MDNLLAAIEAFKKLETDPDEEDLITEIGRLDILNDGKFEVVANGIVRILKHKQTNMCRIVMRKNKTYEIILNHYITPTLYLYPNQIRWKCEDYSSGSKEIKEVMIVFPKQRSDSIDKFRDVFMNARRINDQIINPNNQAYMIIQKCLSEVQDISNMRANFLNLFSQNIHSFIAEDTFFKLPPELIAESIKMSGYTFDFNESKRIVSLTDAFHDDGSSVILLKVLSVSDLHESLSIIGSMKNVPILNAVSSKTESILEQINLKESEQIISRLQSHVEGTPIVSIICKLKMGENIIPVMASISKTSSGNKLICISTDDDSVVLNQPITETTHLWPEMVLWNYDDAEYRLIIPPFNKSDEAKFRETHYRAKYNLL